MNPEKTRPQIDRRATISIQDDLGYLWNLGHAKGHWGRRRESKFSTSYQSPPPNPHLPGATPPERLAALSFAYGSAPLGSPKRDIVKE